MNQTSNASWAIGVDNLGGFGNPIGTTVQV